MKLSCLDDRQKAAGRCADFFLNGENVNDQCVFEASEEEGYVILGDMEPGTRRFTGVRHFIPEFGSPFGYRTRRLNGEVRIVPKEGREQLFAHCLEYGGGWAVDQIAALRDQQDALERGGELG